MAESSQPGQARTYKVMDILSKTWAYHKHVQTSPGCKMKTYGFQTFPYYSWAIPKFYFTFRM